ncbi:MAG: FkbM family methyltransferase [Pirellulaceae bacterium]
MSEHPSHRPIDVGALRLRKCQHGWVLYRPNDIIIGRCFDSFGHFSPSEIRLFQSLLSHGDVVVEAGAYIGCFTAALSQAVGPAGLVYAFEPNPDSFRILCGNLALNDVRNVEARQCGLGACTEERALMMVDTSLLDNFGDVFLMPRGHGRPVDVTTIDSMTLSRCNLIKADVQGMERDILLGAAETISRCRPILYLENDIQENSQCLLATLEALGYQSFWHLPPLCEPDSDISPEYSDHLTQCVSVNLLCLPEESGIPEELDLRVTELRAVTDITDWWQAHD